MKKIKKSNAFFLSLALVAILFFSFFFGVTVEAAQGQSMNQEQNQVMAQEGNQITEPSQNQEMNQEQAQTQAQETEPLQNQEQNGLLEGEQNQIRTQEQTSSQNHGSVVSNFVENLLEVADREQGIGQQVRVIAQEQNQSADRVVQAMEKIQTRSQVKTFFFGSDYKNLGNLRSETVQTRNRLEQLNRLMEQTQNEGDKTEIQNQAQTLEQEQTKIENFIRAQEGKFSLFGWLIKLFNK